MSAENLLVPVIVVGGVAYYLTQHDHPITGAPLPKPPALPGKFPTSTIGSKVAGIGMTGRPAASTTQTTSTGGTRTEPTSGHAGSVLRNIASVPVGNWYKSSTVKVTTDMQKAEAKAKAAYNALGAGAKAAGAAQLNKEFGLDPPLKGDESWEELSRAAGAAIGASAGSYLGGPIGAKIGAIVGAYLGVKLEEFVSDAWDGLKNYADDAWDKASGAVEDAWDDFTDLF